MFFGIEIKPIEFTTYFISIYSYRIAKALLPSWSRFAVEKKSTALGTIYIYLIWPKARALCFMVNNEPTTWVAFDMTWLVFNDMLKY